MLYLNFAEFFNILQSVKNPQISNRNTNLDITFVAFDISFEICCEYSSRFFLKKSSICANHVFYLNVYKYIFFITLENYYLEIGVNS